MTTTQLSVSDLRNQIAKLSEVRTMVCDTPAFDLVNDAIKELKKCINEKTGTRHYNVD
jgi:hypothetical protein